MSINKLIVFDFDGTLLHTPTEEAGKKIWKEKTGYEFPHTGWWGKAESLDTNIFYIPVNEWVYRKYLEAIADDEAYVILATGRLEKVQNMRKNVEFILNDNNLSFDEVHLNTGGDTFRFKCKLFEKLIDELGVEDIIMYDDRHEHLVKFEEWAQKQKVDVTIVDIINKRTKIYDNI